MPTDIATLLTSCFEGWHSNPSSSLAIVCDIEDSMTSITNNLMDATAIKSKLMEETSQATSLSGVAV